MVFNLQKGEEEGIPDGGKNIGDDTAARKFTLILGENMVLYDWKRFHRAGMARYTEVMFCQDYKVEMRNIFNSGIAIKIGKRCDLNTTLGR